MVQISATDITGSWCVSYLARWSSPLGWDVGLWDLRLQRMKSQLMAFNFTAKWIKGSINDAPDVRLSISSKWQLFRIGIKGLWSVRIEKCWRPERNILQVLCTAQMTASIFSLIIVYLDSASDRNRDPAWISAHPSFVFCWRTKPSPCLLASVWRLWLIDQFDTPELIAEGQQT